MKECFYFPCRDECYGASVRGRVGMSAGGFWNDFDSNQ